MKLVFLILIFFPITIYAQNEHLDSSRGKIYEFPDVEAKFPGGSAEMLNYFSENISYSALEIETIPNGRIFISFVVNTDGSIEDVAVFKGVNKGIDKEYVRVVKNMPKWIPAQVNGEKVRSRSRLPFSIHFQ